MEETLTLRQASIDDAPFIAIVMLEAVGMPIMEEGKMPKEDIVEICRRTDTLYSYKNAVVAEIGGKAVGALISYVGDGYHEIKMHTFSFVRDFIDFDVDAMDDETQAGEYYLDSAAVLPEYRGKGIGRELISFGASKAESLGLVPVLACDPENTNAYSLYSSLGFKEDGTLFIFGETYLRMTRNVFVRQSE